MHIFIECSVAEKGGPPPLPERDAARAETGQPGPQDLSQLTTLDPKRAHTAVLTW
jgi:hypothetical protein